MHKNPARISDSRGKSFSKLAGAIALVALTAVTLSACTTGSPSTTWESPNQNLQNTRYAGGRITSSTAPNLGVAWTADLRAANGFGVGAPSPYITQNAAFVQNQGGKLVAYDFLTGRPSAAATFAVNALGVPPWQRRLQALASKLSTEIPPISTTGDDDQHIVVTTVTNQVVAYNVDNRKLVWDRTVKAPSGTAARVLSNMAAAHGSIFAPVTNVPTSESGETPKTLLGKLQALAKSTGQLVSINSDNGKVNWTKNLSSAPLGAVTVANNVAFVTTLDGHIYAFDRDNGDELWSSALPAGTAAPIAISNDTVIVPASVVYKKGQKPQVVAFRIGGLGQIGGATAPTIKTQAASKTAGAAPQQTQAAAPAGPDGKTLFVSNCAGCHTLKAAGTSGNVGPNLDNLKPNLATVQKQVTNGGGGMPPFKGTLSPAEIKAIAQFVSSNAGK